MWIPGWIITTIIRKTRKKPRLDNCLTWALRKWDKEGGYLVIRWCTSAKYPWMRWPHFMWLSSQYHEELRHFIPRDDVAKPERVIPALFFQGKVVRGEHEENVDN
jgi:hypothetical protein